MNGLLKLKFIFHWSTYWEVGNGRSIAYWFDTWDELPLRAFRDGLPRPLRQQMSLQQALSSPSQIPHTKALSEITLTRDEDKLIWRWSTQGTYSANSVYRAMVEGGKTRWSFNEIWKGWAPPKVQLHLYLLLQDRILTREVLVRRGFQCESQCATCNSGLMESAIHLVYHCSYAQKVWSRIEDKWGSCLVDRDMRVPDSVQALWSASWLKVKRSGAMSKKEWAVRMMGVLWHLWRQRNDKIFRNKSVPAKVLANNAWSDSNLWLRYCGGTQNVR